MDANYLIRIINFIRDRHQCVLRYEMKQTISEFINVPQ